MSAELTLLVLGVGGNVSQGILKALAAGGLPCRVVGACTSSSSMGLYTVDRACLSPFADEAGFTDWLIDLCRREGVQGILSGVEPVLEVMARDRETIERETGAVVLVSSPETLAVGGDKLRTARWLSEHGLESPRSLPAEAGKSDLEELGRASGYPLIAKPRAGKGSAGIFEIAGENELGRVHSRRDYLVQEYLGDPAEEYTAATLSDRDGEVRGCIVLHRELRSGTTFVARAGDFPEIHAAAVRIAEALRPMGPCNAQFRLRRGRPVCFEINVRFSGTSPIRARFGFNDVEAAVRHFVLGEAAVELPRITEGVAIRYWNELYADPRAAAVLGSGGALDGRRGWIEDYGARR